MSRKVRVHFPFIIFPPISRDGGGLHQQKTVFVSGRLFDSSPVNGNILFYPKRYKKQEVLKSLDFSTVSVLQLDFQPHFVFHRQEGFRVSFGIVDGIRNFFEALDEKFEGVGLGHDDFRALKGRTENAQPKP